MQTETEPASWQEAGSVWLRTPPPGACVADAAYQDTDAQTFTRTRRCAPQ